MAAVIDPSIRSLASLSRIEKEVMPEFAIERCVELGLMSGLGAGPGIVLVHGLRLLQGCRTGSSPAGYGGLNGAGFSIVPTGLPAAMEKSGKPHEEADYGHDPHGQGTSLRAG